MNDQPVTYQRGEFRVTTDRAAIDLDAALALLRSTFWGGGTTRDLLARAVAGSVCFGCYHRERLVGFGRVVTDLATYAYWTDVVVADGYRGKGLGEWLCRCMLEHPELQGFRRVALLTRDSASLYRRLGFGTDLGDHVYMERRPS